MITAVCFLLLVASVPLFGGRLALVAEVRIKHAWTIVAAVGLQFFVLFVAHDRLPGALAAGLHVPSYVPALAFVWVNRTVRGIAIIVLGGLLNLAAIAANGGVMPAREDALRTAGFPVDNEEFRNSAVLENPKLSFLGDVFAVPAGVPFANVFSIGDVLLVVGGGVFVHSVSGSRLPLIRRRLGDDPPAPRVANDGTHPIDLMSQMDDVEAVALLSFLDKLSTWPTAQLDEAVLAAHIHAFSSLTRDQALRFARLAGHCHRHRETAVALANRRITTAHVELLADAARSATTAFLQDRTRLLRMAATLEPADFEGRIAHWIRSVDQPVSCQPAQDQNPHPVLQARHPRLGVHTLAEEG
ncbi:MAG: DUF5317 domain-containing protein [Actinomycetota bacterium]|nr:DUF5317 domain-containing protein [Actinomycetota bacterium]